MNLPVLSTRSWTQIQGANLQSDLLDLAFLAELQGGTGILHGVEELRSWAGKAVWELWVAGLGV